MARRPPRRPAVRHVLDEPPQQRPSIAIQVLQYGHGWVAALAGVAGVVATVWLASNGGSTPSPSAQPTIAPPTPTAVVSPSPAPETPEAGDHEILAACIGCTDDERTERQSGVDTLIARIASISDAYCNDTTETFADGEAIARVGCSFSGGFVADYVLWPSEADLAGYTQIINVKPGAFIQDWFLFGTGSPRTGTTIEWVEDGAARFYWTYDEFLITGNASLSSGEQDRLNAWWGTTGSLMREEPP